MNLSKMQDNDEAFVNNVFDYPLAYSFVFFKEHWLLEKYQDNDLGIQPLVNLSTVFLSELSKLLIPTTILQSNESANLFSAQNIMSTMTHLLMSVIAKKTMQKKKFLKSYIFQNKHSLIENTTEASSSSYKTNVFKECSESLLENPLLKAQEKQPYGSGTNMCSECGSKGQENENE
ncbi:14151_t:CDS:2 [Cetraspora pellucida]|uniref:14151_t:CDS:1 n=1 Tax=Cetraspora pellucida TaxID=1433469 RepID=A0A9N9NEV5_9GLOM|nr:14151_t:CDS:2 [Cetraspora pellucida]